MKERIRWGLLATGAIARAFADGVKHSQTGALQAAASRSLGKAEGFAEEFGIPQAHGSYEELLENPAVDAIYISTPHPMHAEWAIRGAEAGKHLLVEKPLGINQYEVQAMVAAADANGVFLMEAYMYRCHPQTRRLVELLNEAVIGDVRIIKATFSFQSGFNPNGRLWSNELAGGGILDVGGYTTSIARLIVGAALGQPYADPISVTGAGHLHPETGVDAWAVGTMAFPEDIVAAIATGVGVGQENVVRIFGSEGNIVVPNPYVSSRKGESNGRIIINRRGQDSEEIEIPSSVTSFALEADVCGRAIQAGKKEAEPPAMTWADTLGNLKAQDAWRHAIGLVYASEKPENYRPFTIAKRPLQLRSASPLPKCKLANLDKPLSRLIMGVDNQVTMPHAAAIFDDYYERGGNAFDTGWVYGATKSQLLARWFNTHGIRDQVVVIAKGAHTPRCYPDDLTEQLFEQLDWFDSDYADIYLMHRDNIDVPVGEFVDVLNEHVQAGRIRTFGGSNWSIERVKAANQYAESKGLQGFSVLSNNLSLAVMVEEVWGGCIHAHDSESRAWLQETQTALLPWSSQARGFFLPERARPDLHLDPSLVRCWYSDDNFRRQARAIELAAERGVEPINIALAWVLCQPFPTFPLVGPRQISETASCCRALEIELTEQELLYLDLKSDHC